MSEDWKIGEPPSGEDLKMWQAWLDGRPPVVRVMAEAYPPWMLYRLRSSGHRVVVAAYAEDGTVRVEVLARFNERLDFERQVFGIEPVSDLEQTDVVEFKEPALGTLGDPATLAAARLRLRPDLWRRGPRGTAVWRGPGKEPGS